VYQEAEFTNNNRSKTQEAPWIEEKETSNSASTLNQIWSKDRRRNQHPMEQKANTKRIKGNIVLGMF